MQFIRYQDSCPDSSEFDNQATLSASSIHLHISSDIHPLECNKRCDWCTFINTSSHDHTERWVM